MMKIKVGSKISIKTFIIISTLLYIIIYISLPAAKYYFGGSLSKIMFIFVCTLCLFSAMVYSKRWINIEINSYLPYYLVFVGIILVNLLLERVGRGSNNVLDIFLLYIMMSIGLFLMSVRNKKFDKIVIISYFICMIFTSITTIVGLKVNSNFSRMLTSSSTNTNVVANIEKMNIGAFDFIYSLVLLILPCVLLMKYIKSKKWLILVDVIVIFLSVICIFEAKFTISYLMTIFVCVLILLPSNMKKSHFIFTAICIMFFLIIVGKPILTFILNYLFDMSTSILMRNKLLDLIGVLNGTATLSDATSRIELIMNSIRSFFEAPLLGVGIYYTDYNIVGGHSQIFDDLARYGVIGVWALYMPIYYYFKKMIKSSREYRLSNLYMCVVITYIFLALVNPCTSYYITMTVFIVIPAMIRSVEYEKNSLFN